MCSVRLSTWRSHCQVRYVMRLGRTRSRVYSGSERLGCGELESIIHPSICDTSFMGAHLTFWVSSKALAFGYRATMRMQLGVSEVM